MIESKIFSYIVKQHFEVVANVSVLVSDFLDTFDRGQDSGRLDQGHDVTV